MDTHTHTNLIIQMYVSLYNIFTFSGEKQKCDHLCIRLYINSYAYYILGTKKMGKIKVSTFVQLIVKGLDSDNHGINLKSSLNNKSEFRG